MKIDNFRGIGAIIGDIAGSAYEGRRRKIKTTDFPIFSDRARFTDDTVMTLAIAKGLVEADNPEQIPACITRRMVEAGKAFPHAGYGQRFRHWFNDPVPYESFGNGSAMRVSPAGWLAGSLEEALSLARATASVSHNHPEGIKGAQAVAAAIFLTRQKTSKDELKKYISLEFSYDLNRTVDDIRPEYRFSSSCQGSVPEAIICYLESDSFETAIRLAVSLGGDADTQAAIAGSIAEAAWPIPKKMAEDAIGMLEPKLVNWLMDYQKALVQKGIA